MLSERRYPLPRSSLSSTRSLWIPCPPSPFHILEYNNYHSDKIAPTARCPFELTNPSHYQLCGFPNLQVERSAGGYYEHHKQGSELHVDNHHEPLAGSDVCPELNGPPGTASTCPTRQSSDPGTRDGASARSIDDPLSSHKEQKATGG